MSESGKVLRSLSFLTLPCKTSLNNGRLAVLLTEFYLRTEGFRAHQQSFSVVSALSEKSEQIFHTGLNIFAFPIKKINEMLDVYIICSTTKLTV